jgi:hypothetical protein
LLGVSNNTRRPKQSKMLKTRLAALRRTCKSKQNATVARRYERATKPGSNGRWRCCGLFSLKLCLCRLQMRCDSVARSANHLWSGPSGGWCHFSSVSVGLVLYVRYDTSCTHLVARQWGSSLCGWQPMRACSHNFEGRVNSISALVSVR